MTPSSHGETQAQHITHSLCMAWAEDPKIPHYKKDKARKKMIKQGPCALPRMQPCVLRVEISHTKEQGKYLMFKPSRSNLRMNLSRTFSKSR